MSTVHLASGWVLLVSTCMHIAGTVMHAFAGDRVMARMGLGLRWRPRAIAAQRNSGGD